MVKTEEEIRQRAIERDWYCLVDEEEAEKRILIYLTKEGHVVHFRFGNQGQLWKINSVSR